MLVGDCKVVDIWCTSFRPERERKVYLSIESASLRCKRDFLLLGVAAELAQEWWYDRCITGVMLDRLQECPEEAQPVADQRDWNEWSDQLIQDAVQWIRVHRLHWFE